MRVFIIRHGFRMNWVNNIWKSPTGLGRDPPLAAFGETQAQELADYFLSLPEDERPTAILSSGFYRCLQTAAPTARALGVPIWVEHGIGEWYSHVLPKTGLHPRPGSAESLQAYFPEVAPDGWRTVYYPPKAGEDVAEVHERARACLGALLPRLGAHTRVALFTHAATAITLARALLADARAPLRVGCCTISVFDRAPDAPGDAALGPGLWVPERLADGSHLKEGALRDWGFEDILINESGHVVGDPGEPGTENDVDEPIGLQVPLDGTAKM